MRDATGVRDVVPVRRAAAVRDVTDLAVRDLGHMPYRAAWALQRELVEARLAGTAPDTLLLVEHAPVITVGRGTKGEFLASGVQRAAPQSGDAADAVFIALPGGARAEVIEVERGGQATYHGPGQLVAYPIVKLREGHRDLHAYMRALEQAVIDTLGEHGFATDDMPKTARSNVPASTSSGDAASRGPHAGRKPGATGVWIDGQRKLCSIGVAASRWVTYHGLALNVQPDLSHFAAIKPCGFEAGVMTSVVRERSGSGVEPGVMRAALLSALGVQLNRFREVAVP